MKSQFTGRQSLVVFVLIASAAMLASARGSTDTKPASTDTAPLSVSTFNQRKVVGLLGHKLGTVVRVTGECIDGETKRQKFYASKRVLRIETVNGQKLESPVDFIFPYQTDLTSPNVGERFDYFVHEYGRFDGAVQTPDELIPKDFSGNIGGLDLPSFAYSSSLTIHKSTPLK